MDAIIFDFDGVIVESVDIKTKAFASLYQKFGKTVVGKVVNHHERNSGLSRDEKFRLYHREYLHLEIDDNEVADLAERFSAIVEKSVVAAPFVSGALEFFERNSQSTPPFFVVSGTPEEELKRIVKKKGLDGYFRGVYGSPRKKSHIVEQIISEGGFTPNRVTMVGDSVNDYLPAKQNQVGFVGRVPRGADSPFPEGTLCFESPYLHLESLLKMIR